MAQRILLLLRPTSFVRAIFAAALLISVSGCNRKPAMSRPTAGATGANIAALYVAWGPDKARAFFRKLHDNGIALLGGNAEVADQVGAGIYCVGLTDSDDVLIIRILLESHHRESRDA